MFDPEYLTAGRNEMKIKTSEATGLALNWAVARAANLQIIQVKDGAVFTPHYPKIGGVPFTPTTNWSQGGPIIEWEVISVVGSDPDPKQWNAHQEGLYFMEGCPTPLVAAMRCYVASKLGDEVEIPSWLVRHV